MDVVGSEFRSLRLSESSSSSGSGISSSFDLSLSFGLFSLVSSFDLELGSEE